MYQTLRVSRLENGQVVHVDENGKEYRKSIPAEKKEIKPAPANKILSEEDIKLLTNVRSDIMSCLQMSKEMKKTLVPLDYAHIAEDITNYLIKYMSTKQLENVFKNDMIRRKALLNRIEAKSIRINAVRSLGTRISNAIFLMNS